MRVKLERPRTYINVAYVIPGGTNEFIDRLHSTITGWVFGFFCVEEVINVRLVDLKHFFIKIEKHARKMVWLATRRVGRRLGE